MSRRTNLINNVLYMVLTPVALFVVVYICNNRYSTQFLDGGSKFLVGAIIASLVATFAHELGHVIGGKRAGFKFSSMCVWFFKWTRRHDGIRFSFCVFGGEAGYTDMIATTDENIEKRLKKMTSSALIASFTMILIGIVPLFLTGLSLWGYCLLSVFLPVGIYSFLGNALPMSNEGFLTDGAVINGINKKHDTMMVALSLLKIQAQMYNGKTPSEIDEVLYFDLPQLPEDDPNFTLLLSARHAYYLDKGDYENAKDTLNRLNLMIEEESMPKQFIPAVKADMLYALCTFDFNEDKADDVMYEIEQYLNKNNSVSNVRVKLAYILRVRKENDLFEQFYNKAVKEANRCQIKGFGKFENKLLEKFKSEYFD